MLIMMMILLYVLTNFDIQCLYIVAFRDVGGVMNLSRGRLNSSFELQERVKKFFEQNSIHSIRQCAAVLQCSESTVHGKLQNIGILLHHGGPICLNNLPSEIPKNVTPSTNLLFEKSLLRPDLVFLHTQLTK